MHIQKGPCIVTKKCGLFSGRSFDSFDSVVDFSLLWSSVTLYFLEISPPLLRAIIAIDIVTCSLALCVAVVIKVTGPGDPLFALELALLYSSLFILLLAIRMLKLSNLRSQGGRAIVSTSLFSDYTRYLQTRPMLLYRATKS